jgi:hypothetical protein
MHACMLACGLEKTPVQRVAATMRGQTPLGVSKEGAAAVRPRARAGGADAGARRGGLLRRNEMGGGRPRGVPVAGLGRSRCNPRLTPPRGAAARRRPRHPRAGTACAGDARGRGAWRAWARRRGRVGWQGAARAGAAGRVGSWPYGARRRPAWPARGRAGACLFEGALALARRVAVLHLAGAQPRVLLALGRARP